jgi:hypothetical protein
MLRASLLIRDEAIEARAAARPISMSPENLLPSLAANNPLLLALGLPIAAGDEPFEASAGNAWSIDGRNHVEDVEFAIVDDAFSEIDGLLPDVWLEKPGRN